MEAYVTMKVKVHSLDRDTDYFDTVAGVLQGDRLDPYLFIICQGYMLRMSIDLMKENGFKLAKERSRRYPTQTITDTDYADDIVLLANIPTQAESLLHSLEHRPPCQCRQDRIQYIYIYIYIYIKVIYKYRIDKYTSFCSRHL